MHEEISSTAETSEETPAWATGQWFVDVALGIAREVVDRILQEEDVDRSRIRNMVVGRLTRGGVGTDVGRVIALTNIVTSNVRAILFERAKEAVQLATYFNVNGEENV